MSELQRKPLRVTRLRVSDLPEESERHALETLFHGLEAAKSDAVRAERLAQRAANKAQIERAEAIDAELELLEHASTHFAEIGREQTWFIYRKDNEIYFESPFTERDVRNAIRVQRDQLNHQARQLDEGQGGESLYEEDPDDE